VKEDLNEALSRIDISEYLDREGIPYKRTHGSSGAQLNVKTCPACGTSKWKVYLNETTGLGNCFSGDCQKRFNKYSFIAAHLGGLPFAKVAEHIEVAARDMGWRPVRRAQIAVNESGPLVIPESVELPYEGKAPAYLLNRGITPEMMRYFHLRYSAKGVFHYKMQGLPKWMDFGKRIIIPVYDLDGNLVSFQGRDITGTAERKYLFPPGFAVTGRHLYNAHNVRNVETVVVGEGAFDVIAIKMALLGDPELRNSVEPVGTFGKHLSEGPDSQLERFETLRDRGVKNVVIMWDGEKQATDDAFKAAKLLTATGLGVRVALLPKDRDPNEIPASAVLDAFYASKPSSDLSALLKAKLMRRAENWT
jgi:DNA primase